MAIAASCARSFLRSSSFRNAAPKIASGTKASRPSIGIPKQKLISNSSFRSSCCVVSLMPLHTATSSALLTSMLSVSPSRYGWLLEACNTDIS